MDKKKAFIGVDIGLKGGIGVICEGKVVFKTPMPLLTEKEVDIRQLSRMLRACKKKWDCTVCFEYLQAIHMVGASQTFGLGFQAGLIEGIVSGLGFPYKRMKAVEWQKLMFVGIKPVYKKVNKKSKLDTKAMARSSINRIFPNVDFRPTKKSKNPHEGVVDAILMAKYLERKGI